MKLLFGTAKLAVVCIAVAATGGGLGAANAADTPFGADLLAIAPLPQGVAEDGIVAHFAISQVKDEGAFQPRAASLAALVARHGQTATQDRQMHCLATAVYYESKGEPLIGQLAVAEVILNRARSGRFPGTACGVVTQRGQFSFVRRGALPAVPKAGRAWREAIAVAHVASQALWQGPAAAALFFHARHVAPRWRLARVAAVGNHIFYR